MGIYLNNQRVVFFIILLIIVSLLYSSTFQAPFNFDDEAVIKSEIVQEGAQAWFGDFFSNPRYRHLFYSSLILNYSLGKFDPLGYHLINTLLHFLTSIVIFFISSMTIEKGLSLGRKDSFTIASLTTLLFAVNPINSEAVNYISARASGMSCFFYLSALLFFILGSLRKQKKISKFLFYFSSLVFFLAAVLSKETALTFPLMLFLYDFCFMQNNCFTTLKNRFLFFYLPLFSCSAFAVFKIYSMTAMIIDWWQRIDLQYGLKQIQVIAYGARVILFPIGLTFDYHFPSSFFTTNTFLTTASLLILAIILVSALCFTKARIMVFFCSFWFLLTLAPTNSIFPRADLLSERNLYLPSFGIIFLLIFAIHQLVMSNQSQPMVKKIGASCLIIFFILQFVLLNKRNLVYRSNTHLWKDTLNKSPGKLRALHNLSHFYMAEKNYAEAFIALRSLTKSKASPHYIAYAHSNLGSIYLQFGNLPKAESEFMSGIRAKPTLPTNYFNLGALLASQGRTLEAKKLYEKAEYLYKNYKWGYQTPADLYINKARLLLKLKLYDEAETSIDEYLKRIPDSAAGHFIRANIYSATGKLEQSLNEYSTIENVPKLKAQAHNNRALIFIKMKSFSQAFEELNQALMIDPNLIDAYYNLGNLLIQTEGDLIKARQYFKKALKQATNEEETKRIKSALKNLP
jgi:protein O-mannosyl-transferase